MEKLEYISDLKSGATISQTAKLYKTQNTVDYSSNFDLSYSDLINITLSLKILCEFYDVNATVFVKNNTLTSVALGTSIFDSFTKAIDSNPLDSVCGVVAFSKSPDLDVVKLLSNQQIVVVPELTSKVIEYLETNNINYLILNTPLKDYKRYIIEEAVITPFGTIIQEANKSELDKDMFKVVSKTKPTVEQIEDAIFAWKITKYLKSSSVVVAKNFQTHGLSQGLNSNAVEFALNNACDNSKDAVLAIDIPLNIHDLNVLIQDRISLVILPGVSADVLKVADKYGISVITTGISNFSLY